VRRCAKFLLRKHPGNVFDQCGRRPPYSSDTRRCPADELGGPDAINCFEAWWAEPGWLDPKTRFTLAGITAGMDLALALVEEDHGHEVALEIARILMKPTLDIRS